MATLLQDDNAVRLQSFENFFDAARPGHFDGVDRRILSQSEMEPLIAVRVIAGLAQDHACLLLPAGA